MMTTDEPAVVVVVTNGSLEYEAVTLWRTRQEFDAHRRHIGTLVKHLVECVYEKHPQLHEELLRLNKINRPNKFKKKRTTSS